MLKTISIKQNTAANYAGTFCQAILSFLFIPLYVKYLGIESYGLIVFSVSLSVLLKLADLGLSSTLSREFACYLDLPDSAQRMRDLLKTLQTVYWIIFLLIGLAALLFAPLIAKYWINSGTLDINTVQRSVMLMGLTAALQAPMGLYLGGIFGLQRHVLANVINIIFALFRFGGAALALELIAPTITMFFYFQFAVTSLGALSAGFILWRLLPPAALPSGFRIEKLKSIWRFALGMSITSILGMILFQLDKIILVKILPLEVFGYYALAGTVAAAVTYLGGPLFATFLPRYTQLYAAGNDELLRMTYRKSCRLNAVITIPTVTFLALFSREALLIWTGNADIARHTYVLLSLLGIGYGLNLLAGLPFALQIAAGWVKMGVYTNAAAIMVIVPALVIASSLYQGVGAAVVWIVLNCIYVFVCVGIVHRRILRKETPHWYAGMIRPLVFSVGLGLFGRYLLPEMPMAGFAICIGFLWAAAVIASFLTVTE